MESTLVQSEQKVFDFVYFHGGSLGVNPITVAYALPVLDVYAIIQRLVDRGMLERVGRWSGKNCDQYASSVRESRMTLPIL